MIIMILIHLNSSDGYDAGRAAEIIAQSFCPALVPCLESLVESKITKIGLRVTLDPDKVIKLPSTSHRNMIIFIFVDCH